jgi:hypothetical protein
MELKEITVEEVDLRTRDNLETTVAKYKQDLNPTTALDITLVSVSILNGLSGQKARLKYTMDKLDGETKKIYSQAKLKSLETTDPKREADARTNADYLAALDKQAAIVAAYGRVMDAYQEVVMYHYVFKSIAMEKGVLTPDWKNV